MRNAISLVALWFGFTAQTAAAQDAQQSKTRAGPLRVHPTNPRYFTDGTKNPDGTPRAVYLTGSHTWNNLIDMRRDDSSPPFDFDAYLDFLERHGHNFIRLWAWDSSTWDTRANGDLGKDFIHECAPLPWPRTGPGKARDGKPKFDLTKLDPAYFERLRNRVSAAGRRGIYVSVMLFEGWGLMHGNRRRGTKDAWAWHTHPFHADNNTSGVNGDVDGDGFTGEIHRLADEKVNALQAAYIRKVVDTVNDLDNVLYEVINEGGQKDWDWWVVKEIHDYERTKPKQHPVGITGHGAEKLPSMAASPAEWISPGRVDGFGENPPEWDGKKISLLDTDHIWGVGGNAAWVWKSFLRGHNPIFMDPYDGSVLGKPSDPRWEPVRKAMGQTRRLAQRVNLAALTPQSKLASSGYCLANPGKEYLVYLPQGGSVSVNVSAAKDQLAARWFGIRQGIAIFGTPGTRQFEFVLSGRHGTIRCDGNSAEHVCFGGPILYGHEGSGGYFERANHADNVFWHQAVEANRIYQMLDGRQRRLALLPEAPDEAEIAFRGNGRIDGIAVTELSADQKENLQRVLRLLLEPYRQSDRDEAVAALKRQGGLDRCFLTFYRRDDLGDDGVWDNWRLEGPAFVWHYRGAPHVHVWVNIADDPRVTLNARNLSGALRQ